MKISRRRAIWQLTGFIISIPALVRLKGSSIKFSRGWILRSDDDFRA